jgi:hypothetical protein
VQVDNAASTFIANKKPDVPSSREALAPVY